MKLSVVLNGGAGTLLGQAIDEVIADVRRLFEEAGHTADVTAATGPAIVAAIDRAVASDADVVVVGGGDGTVATAAGFLSPSFRLSHSAVPCAPTATTTRLTTNHFLRINSDCRASGV